MKKVFTAFIVGLAFVMVTTISAFADTESDIKALKKQISDMQKKLDQLETKKAAAPAGAANIVFHGWFRGRIHQAEANQLSSDVTSKNLSSFEATEFALQPHWDVTDHIHGDVHLWFWPNTAADNGLGATYMESAYITLDDIGFGKGSELRAGKDRNWCFGITPSGKNRKTSNYSIYHATITQARVVGLQLLNKLDKGKLELNIAILNGFDIGTRALGTANYSGLAGGDGYNLIANRDLGLDSNNNRAISLRIAGKAHEHLKLGASFYTSRLSDSDATMIRGLSDAPVTDTTKTQQMFGADFAYDDGRWIWQAEYTDVQMATLDLDGFNTTVGYIFNDISSLYLGYSLLDFQHNIDMTVAANAADVTNAPAWDKQQLVVSYKHKLAPKAWLQLEHEFNFEDEPAGFANGAVTDNDLTFLELMIVY